MLQQAGGASYPSVKLKSWIPKQVVRFIVGVL